MDGGGATSGGEVLVVVIGYLWWCAGGGGDRDTSQLSAPGILNILLPTRSGCDNSRKKPS